ncbi:hypothetical protein RND81_09G216400 [Saponaria officinalis]|uniref:Myb-like domain-containing protein n=1 Tax=Saponaria officinalis TaxID=3572 RepID=A0AAW1IQL8_SAPOF
MFDGMPDHFLPATSTPSPPTCSLPPPFPLHHSNFQQHCFDSPYLLLQNPQIPLHLQQQQRASTRNESNVVESVVNSVIPTTSLMVPQPWSSEEVLSLLKIISSLDNPWSTSHFTWDNVSRKLAEVGFKRSAEKCKEKFEEETRSFNNNGNKLNHVVGQNYRLFGELEALCSNGNGNGNDNDGDYVGNDLGNHDQEQSGPNDKMDKDDDNRSVAGEEDGEECVDDSEKREEKTKKVLRKRKREKKFEMFKGFCENIVNKLIAQQEELHCKILQDMVKRDKEKIAREEAWKKQEIDRITQVMQVRAHEQAIVGDRQAKILGFLKKFSSSTSSSNNVEMNPFIGETFGREMVKVQNTNNSLLSTSESILSQDCISVTTHDQNLPTLLSKESLGPQSRNNRLENPQLNQPCESPTRPASSLPCKSVRFDHTSTDAAGQVMNFESPENHTDSIKDMIGDVKDDIGRRWPRDEVLALINIRCNLFNNNGDHRDRESFSKGPLWERISQKMMELGYKRSAKRCKEKWENINKYFRKTKDLNRKRSIDSRTCPYFHQLNHLYNQQGTPLGQSDRQANLTGLPGNNQLAPSSSDGATAANAVPSQQNDGIMVQLPTCQASSVLNFDYNIT